MTRAAKTASKAFPTNPSDEEHPAYLMRLYIQVDIADHCTRIRFAGNPTHTTPLWQHSTVHIPFRDVTMHALNVLSTQAKGIRTHFSTWTYQLVGLCAIRKLCYSEIGHVMEKSCPWIRSHRVCDSISHSVHWCYTGQAMERAFCVPLLLHFNLRSLQGRFLGWLSMRVLGAIGMYNALRVLEQWLWAHLPLGGQIHSSNIVSMFKGF